MHQSKQITLPVILCRRRLSPQHGIFAAVSLLFILALIKKVSKKLKDFHDIQKSKTKHKSEVHAYIGEDNPFIHTGHRDTPLSTKECLRSVVAYHNETFNIWSHGMASIYFVYILLRDKNKRHARETAIPVQLFGCILAYGISAGAHTFNHHSKEVSELAFDLDRAGIAIMLSTKALAFGSIRFSNKFYRYSHALATVLSGIFTAIKVNNKRSSPKEKAAAFSIQTALNIFPLITELLRYKSDSKQLFLDAIVTFGLCGMGGFVYAYRFPERFLPGRLDIFGNGHQLMHVLAFGSSTYAYYSLWRYYNWRRLLSGNN